MAARWWQLALASGDEGSPLHGAEADDVEAADGKLYLKQNPNRGETYEEILKRHKEEMVEVTQESKPGDEMKKFSMHALGAVRRVRTDPTSARCGWRAS
jgi:xanthine dehydrogenase YagR molybdenum-binding subunit